MNPFSIPKIYDAGGDLSRQWYVHYSFQHPETGTKQRFRVAISRALKTKSDRHEQGAEIKADLKTKLLRGFNPFFSDDKRKTNCIDALDYVKRYKRATLGKRSGSTYGSAIGKFQAFLATIKYDNKPIEVIGRRVAELYADHMIMDEQIGNRTINNRIGFLRTVFNLLIKKEYIEVNPFVFVDYLPCREPEITAFTRKELQLISEHLPAYHYQLYVISQLIFYCFLRPQELVRLQFKDVLWEHRIITIPGEKSKNGKSQVIVMPDKLIENLEGWKLNWPADYYLFAHGHELRPGQRETASTRIAEVWRVFANKYGIKKNIYDMKHTGNGMAVDAGLNIRDIQLQNRHHSLEQTQQYLDKFRRKASSGFIEGFRGF